jgi:hypothetical protein
MNKTFFLKIAVGGAASFILLATLFDFRVIPERLIKPAEAVTWGMIFLGGLGVAGLLILLARDLVAHIGSRLEVRAKAEAHDELLKWKRLLDDKIVSVAEFEAKAAELKARL